MRDTPPAELLNSAADTIRRHGLIDRSQPVMVALSGGKDSLLLCLVLRAMGIAHRAVTIDMGYEAGWADRISLRAHMIGIVPEIVSARELPDMSSAALATVGLRRRLTVLDAVDPATKPTVTPCTYCYNVKVLLLDAAAAKTGASQVAFAHHMTDAAASLLKEALLHVDRFDRGHTHYTRANFESLVRELTTAADKYDAEGDQPLLRTIERLVAATRVGTDEPPRQPLRRDRPDGVEVVRPFFDVDEDTIIRAVRHGGIQAEGSGCGHGATLASQTPREMLHYRVLAGRGDTRFFAHVAQLVRHGIGLDGSSTVRARLQRQELLGHQYKPVVGEFDKL